MRFSGSYELSLVVILPTLILAALCFTLPISLGWNRRPTYVRLIRFFSRTPGKVYAMAFLEFLLSIWVLTIALSFLAEYHNTASWVETLLLCAAVVFCNAVSMVVRWRFALLAGALIQAVFGGYFLTLGGGMLAWALMLAALGAVTLSEAQRQAAGTVVVDHAG